MHQKCKKYFSLVIVSWNIVLAVINAKCYIHSFIHSEHLYSAPSRSYSEALPAQPRLKKKVLRDL